MNKTEGIHHITAIAGDPQANLDFYCGILGLRFVKRTVNFDDPFTYHFYYGNEAGSPGTVLTFFPWGRNALKGRKGNGQVTSISYSIPKNSIEFWKSRLEKNKIDFTEYDKFGDSVLLFSDQDEFDSELIAVDDERKGFALLDIPEEHSVRGFHSAAFSLSNAENTISFMQSNLGFEILSTEKNITRLSSGSGKPGTIIDVLNLPDNIPGRMGVGAIHHIAYRAKDDEHQLKLKDKIETTGAYVTEVLDRNYFHSIYFREPGNILFEIATDSPGFLIDESQNELGSHLKLPPWEETRRREIENKLPKIVVPK